MKPTSRDTTTDEAAARPAPTCTMVIFGVNGDLAKRLLMPALYNLSGSKLLERGFSVLGIDRAASTDKEFRARQRESMESFTLAANGEFAEDTLNEAWWDWLEARLHYMAGDFTQPELFSALAKVLKDGNALFYLAVGERFFGNIVDMLHKAGLTTEKEGTFRRVVVEKPFGHDVSSARALNTRLLTMLKEPQIYRIDHFLGKETVRNIMALRFANGIFEPLWNRDHIDSIQITTSETVGVEQRGRFYDGTGAVRDMVPNHLFQLLAMTAMEPPNSFDAEAVRSEKSKVIGAIRPMTATEAEQCVVRGQYSAGCIGNREVAGYRDEPDVAKDSTVETFVALKLEIDNWRWAGVPFYLRTGKRMSARCMEIAITFKPVPFMMFRGTTVDRLTPNTMVLRLQPREGISLEFSAKQPGPMMTLGGVRMEFCYEDFFDLLPASGYETLLYDAMIGDATLFNREDNIEAGWTGVQPILDAVVAGR